MDFQYETQTYVWTKRQTGSEHADKFGGNDVRSLFHLKKNSLTHLNKKKASANDLLVLKNRMKTENKKQFMYGLAIIVFIISVFVAGMVYFSKRFDLF